MQSSCELSVEIILSGAYYHQKSLSMDTIFFSNWFWSICWYASYVTFSLQDRIGCFNHRVITLVAVVMTVLLWD